MSTVSEALNLNVLSIGGSRNIGYFSSLKLLELGATVTFLLRSPSTFDTNSAIQKYVTSGTARLIKGDALVREDLERAWKEAAAAGPVDVLLFTVGGTPKFSLLKGFTISPPNLVTQSRLNALSTIPSQPTQPRIITISSTGLTPASHAALPLLLKPLYGYLLRVPHKDKLGAERVVAHCAGWKWDDAEEGGEPGVDIMGTKEWRGREGLPKEGELKRVLVVRPALLTDGECLAEKLELEQGKGVKKESKKAYRVSEKELGGWTVSRKDVAHFVVDAIVHRWDDKCVSIAY